MNAKSKVKVMSAEREIVMNTIFEKMMQNPLSDEYALLQRIRQDYPTFTVRRRQIKPAANKESYKGLTYEYMRTYIGNHEPEETREAVMSELEHKIEISKCHSTRYPTIKKWFLEQYPEVAKFGMPETENAPEGNDQKVIPMTAANQTAELDAVG